jgi:AAA domain, putative AbiEii toxin, Type IV TA system
MLKSLKIENFRGFERFELKQLGRINLLVGENNSGKTSILEAIRLLYSNADLTSLREQMLYRGELFPPNKAHAGDDLDVRHLFNGHELERGSECDISGRKLDGLFNRLIIKVDQTSKPIDLGRRSIYRPLSPWEEHMNSNQVQVSSGDQPALPIEEWLLFLWMPKMKIKSMSTIVANFPEDFDLSLSNMETVSLGLLPDQGISSELFRAYRQFDDRYDLKLQWVPSNALSAKEMIDAFNQIVLTPEEELATEALQIIDPTIRRVAPSGTHNHESGYSHGGFLVLKNGMSQRVPIGSMGDGIWRCLGLALKIANAKDGILLVDEIDTGLHFSTMLGMWKMIWKTAERLNVQVFATTHSRDCWESLAEVAESEGIQGDEVMIHRIERGRKSSVTFNSPQMTIASEHSIEVR